LLYEVPVKRYYPSLSTKLTCLLPPGDVGNRRNKSLALNIPTACFYTPVVNSFDAKAQPLINELEHNLILHRSGKDAARFVSSISENPLKWWSKANVQEARFNFVRHYANFSEHWLQEWEDEFQTQIQN